MLWQVPAVAFFVLSSVCAVPAQRIFAPFFLTRVTGVLRITHEMLTASFEVQKLEM